MTSSTGRSRAACPCRTSRCCPAVRGQGDSRRRQGGHAVCARGRGLRREDVGAGHQNGILPVNGVVDGEEEKRGQQCGEHHLLLLRQGKSLPAGGLAGLPRPGVSEQELHAGLRESLQLHGVRRLVWRLQAVRRAAAAVISPPVLQQRGICTAEFRHGALNLLRSQGKKRGEAQRPEIGQQNFFSAESVSAFRWISPKTFSGGFLKCLLTK